jgi:dTDP-4-amino-4,6-dideoxygalactose transaminase
VHDRLGSNWRMGELHAAAGIAQFQRLGGTLARRRELARWYDEHLAGLPGLHPHPVPAGSVGNAYKYVALLDDGIDRAALKRRLAERHQVRLAGEVYDTPLHRQPYLAERFAGRGFPEAERFADRHVCLPLFPGMTAAQLEAVRAALEAELR